MNLIFFPRKSDESKPRKHEIVVCPRCNARFECKLGTITECQCMQVQLSPNQIRKIRETYTGCLCASCLKELAQENLSE